MGAKGLNNVNPFGGGITKGLEDVKNTKGLKDVRKTSKGLRHVGKTSKDDTREKNQMK